MDMHLTKMELIEMLLHTQKASVLQKIRAILEEEQDRLSEDDYAIIDARRERHISNISASYSWEEAKKKIQKR